MGLYWILDGMFEIVVGVGFVVLCEYEDILLIDVLIGLIVVVMGGMVIWVIDGLLDICLLWVGGVIVGNGWIGLVDC